MVRDMFLNAWTSKRARFFVLTSALLFQSSVPVYALDPGKAGYVGRDACAGCHAEEVKLWQGSHHDMSQAYSVNTAFMSVFCTWWSNMAL